MDNSNHQDFTAQIFQDHRKRDLEAVKNPLFLHKSTLAISVSEKKKDSCLALGNNKVRNSSIRESRRRKSPEANCDQTPNRETSQIETRTIWLEVFILRGTVREDQKSFISTTLCCSPNFSRQGFNPLARKSPLIFVFTNGPQAGRAWIANWVSNFYQKLKAG